MVRFIKSMHKAWKLSIIGAVGVLLVACNSDPNPTNTVTGTPSQFAYSTAVNTTINPTITFNSNGGTASNLNMSLANLPRGWTQVGGGTTFQCNSISTTGSACQLQLQYSPSFAVSNTSLTLNYTYNMAGGGAASGSVTFSYAATGTSNNFAYVADDGVPGNVYSCLLNSTGGMTGCEKTPASSAPSWNPTSITFATPSGGSKNAYVTSVQDLSPTNNNIQQCSINADGTFGTCSTTTMTYNNSGTPTAITQMKALAFNTAGNGTTYAYIPAESITLGTGLWQCSFASGAFSNCSQTGTFGLFQLGAASNIQFATVGSAVFAYVLDQTNKHVFYCGVNNDGTLGTCTATGSGVGTDGTWVPVNIAFNTAGDGNQYAYVTDSVSPGHVWQCPVAPSGSLGTCTASGFTIPTDTTPAGISFNTTAGTTYAYISVTGILGGIAYQCSLNNDGSINNSSCADATGSSGPAWQPVNFGFTAP